MVLAAIEKLLVDFFDANGFEAERRGEDWFLRIGDGEVSLTEAAFALDEFIRTKL